MHACMQIQIWLFCLSHTVECTPWYLGGVGVTIGSTNRRRVNHGAGFALGAGTLVQTGVFKAGEN